MKQVLWIMIAGLCIGLAGNAGATMLSNGGFETGDFSGWTEFGTVAQAVEGSPFAVYEDTYGVWMKAWNINYDGGYYQDVSASEGNVYTLDAAIKVPTNFINNGSVLEVSLIFLNSSGTELSRVSNVWDSANGSTTNVYLPMTTVQACAPLKTATARVNVHWTTDGVIEESNNSSPMSDSFVLTESAFGLANGGFETDNTFTNWTEFGGAEQGVATATWAAHEGTNGVRMRGWNLNQDGGFYQDVVAAPGFDYTLNAYIKIGSEFHQDAGDTVTVALQCLDASDTLLDESSHAWSPAAMPATLDAFFAIDPLVVTGAPAGTAKVRARVHWTTDENRVAGGQESAMADNVALTLEFVPSVSLFCADHNALRG